MESHFARLSIPRHYALGKHCVGALTKQEFAANTKASGSFENLEAGGVTFVILDSCFRSDGTPYERKNFEWKDANVPKQELCWLASQLSKAGSPIIILAHQPPTARCRQSPRRAQRRRSALAPRKIPAK